jgi:SAM-dependent methyltransferase
MNDRLDPPASNLNLLDLLIASVREKGLLSEAYSINKVAEPLAGTEPPDPPWKLLVLIVDAALTSADFRAKVFQPGFPVEIGKIGYMSDVDLRYAIAGGFQDASMVADYIGNYCDLPGNADVLDFGCGTLRVSRYLIQFAKGYTYHACDVNPFSMEWARNEFGNLANVFVMKSSPPLGLGEQSIDFAVAWSIFSHYSETAYRAWLMELHRILRPGGYLFITFQSDHLLGQIRHDAQVQARYMAENVDLDDVRSNYLDRGFASYACYPRSGGDFGFDVDNFGMAFISPDYIERDWGKLFDIVRIDTGVVGNRQDVLLLRKRP